MGQGQRPLNGGRRRFVGVAAAGATTVGLPAWLAGCGRSSPALEGGFAGIDMARGHALRDGRWASQPVAKERRTRVLIAGGGVAGLAAARALRQTGIDDFALLELEDEAGGNARGGQVGGLACPLGAHYLPVPGDDAREVQDLLEELGVRRREAGRWVYDERHLCHSPQERLFFHGEWQDGLLPLNGVGADTLAQYRRFAQKVEALRRAAHFAIPTLRAAPSALLADLDRQSFAAWLDAEGLDDPQLRWYLGYCCRDDYGAGLAQVSAWAGLHYFASRHGFHAPGDGLDAEREAVLTWPEGNAWLTRRLAAPLAGRLQTGQVVLRIEQTRSGVAVDAWDAAAQQRVRWQAQQSIVALPAFVAARVVASPPAFLSEFAAGLRYSPWLVANLHLSSPLRDRPGAAPSWDNVVYGTRGLGYVDAGHQRLDPTPAPTVLSWYRPLGPSEFDGGDGRRLLAERPWEAWRDEMLAELSVPHPDLAERATRLAITRYGHAMAVPTPGLRGHLTRIAPGGEVQASRLHFAHADWSGYSIFEEAFTRGHLAGEAAARAA